jgi:hypothetical protein
MSNEKKRFIYMKIIGIRRKKNVDFKNLLLLDATQTSLEGENSSNHSRNKYQDIEFE